MNKITALIIIFILCCTCLGCSNKSSYLMLATTTSTEQTGLLDAIIPNFTDQTGIDVKVISAGTGQALVMGRKGEVDILIVHDQEEEEIFVAEGFGIERHDLMFNDFILLGYKPLPDEYSKDIIQAFQYIEKEKLPFVSRGDDSGTHKMEKRIWREVGEDPVGEWYVSVGRGMGETIQMADEKNAYTLSDRSTYLSMIENTDLIIVLEDHINLKNQYGVIAVKHKNYENSNEKEALSFIEWILSEETQEAIRNFGIEKYGKPLFYPNAKE